MTKDFRCGGTPPDAVRISITSCLKTCKQHIHRFAQTHPRSNAQPPDGVLARQQLLIEDFQELGSEVL